jgi:hypothetical protein
MKEMLCNFKNIHKFRNSKQVRFEVLKVLLQEDLVLLAFEAVLLGV